MDTKSMEILASFEPLWQRISSRDVFVPPPPLPLWEAELRSFEAQELSLAQGAGLLARKTGGRPAYLLRQTAVRCQQDRKRLQQLYPHSAAPSLCPIPNSVRKLKDGLKALSRAYEGAAARARDPARKKLYLGLAQSKKQLSYRLGT